MILWGERCCGRAALPALLNVAGRLGLAARDGAGLLEVPSPRTGAVCARPASQPNAGPRPRRALADPRPRRARGIAAGALADGELAALYLLHVDPVRDTPTRRCGAARWRARRP